MKQGRKDCVLFFGCRGKKKDFFFESEWSSMQDNGELLLYTAFSRDQDQKIYVQHKLEEAGELIWDFIHNKDSYFFIAGNAKQMPNDVINSLKKIIEKYGNMNEEEAELYFKKLEMKRRFQCETWS